MKMIAFAMLASLMVGPSFAADAPKRSPYAGEEQRDMKALSPDFIEGLKAGAGLGSAKSAELKGYPGPAHLLELQREIPLDGAQVGAITELRDDVRSGPIALGVELLDAEAALEAAFRDRDFDQARLGELTDRAGVLRAELRATHLNAHIQASALLNLRQIHRYQVLRGYAGDQTGGHTGHGHKH